MNLKIGGSNVAKIMYNGQEFGSQKLEPGTILYLSGSDLGPLNDSNTLGPDSTREITFHNVGKHWEGLKKIRFYHGEGYGGMEDSGKVFDVNSIDESTQTQGKDPLTIHRERSLTDEPDKLIVTAHYGIQHIVVITVEEWN